MQHYLYVTDADGEEIPGSRKSIDRVSSRAQLAAIEAELTAKIGEGCSVDDNVSDWRDFWRDRNSDGRA